MENRSHYIAMVAHELRGPLLPILNAASILKRQPLDSDVVFRCASIIDRQARIINRRVDDLLDVSRFQLGDFPLTRARVSLLEIVRQSVEIVSPSAAQKGVAVVVTMAGDRVEVDADAGRLGQALQNLLLNAVKFSDKGRDIHVRAHREGDYAVLAVTDNGIGLDGSEIESIFELFAQADPQGSARSSGGLGIGLYLARRFTLAHGGTLTAESAGLGTGSTFTMRVPALEPDQPEAAGRQAAPSSRSVSFLTTA